MNPLRRLLQASRSQRQIPRVLFLPSLAIKTESFSIVARCCSGTSQMAVPRCSQFWSVFFVSNGQGIMVVRDPPAPPPSALALVPEQLLDRQRKCRSPEYQSPKRGTSTVVPRRQPQTILEPSLFPAWFRGLRKKSNCRGRAAAVPGLGSMELAQWTRWLDARPPLSRSS